MKKQICLVAALIFALMVGLTGCHNLVGDLSPTETYVSSYEIAGAVYPLAKVYLGRLEETQVLVGEKLVAYKASYAKAQGFGVQAGDILKNYIENPGTSIIANYPVLLQQVVIILADLSGGKLVNASDKPTAMKGADKEYMKGVRVVVDPAALKKASIKAKGVAITPDQVILTLNLLLMAVDKLVAYWGVPDVLTPEQKMAYIARVKFTQGSIPAW